MSIAWMGEYPIEEAFGIAAVGFIYSSAIAGCAAAQYFK